MDATNPCLDLLSEYYIKSYFFKNLYILIKNKDEYIALIIRVKYILLHVYKYIFNVKYELIFEIVFLRKFV